MSKEYLKERIENDFTYHKPLDENQIKKYKCIRDSGKIISNTFIDLCPESRELSIALTKIDEAIMFANAAIARNEKNNCVDGVCQIDFKKK